MGVKIEWLDSAALFGIYSFVTETGHYIWHEKMLCKEIKKQKFPKIVERE